jgi:3-methyladenine DNA glycosylase AlkD
MHPYIKPIQQLFEQHANASDAVGMKAYMLHQFEFYGIKTPIRRKLDKDFAKAHPIVQQTELSAIVTELFKLPQREYHYCAIELLGHHHNIWNENIIDTIEFCLITNSWWDSVDHVAIECFPRYFKLFPHQKLLITKQWNQSSNIWLQRSSIMFQRTFKQATDSKLLAQYILHCAESKEFFIQKAIGWALREYAKTNPAWVKAFVEKYQNRLSALSRREALKHFYK